MSRALSEVDLDETHDVNAASWVNGADAHLHFPIQNLPLGRFAGRDDVARLGVAIGNSILDVSGAIAAGLLDVVGLSPEAKETIARGDGAVSLRQSDRRTLRRAIFAALHAGNPRSSDGRIGEFVLDADTVEMLLPTKIGGYTDFFAGIHHARTAGAMFRPDNPLLPNYKFVPIGYSGRASSVGVSPATVSRPLGQVLGSGDTVPIVRPTGKLDYEFELAIWISETASKVEIAEAGDSIAGFGILNDWSARDVQRWEAVPLGPFLAKSFATTVSPWVVTPEALAPFRVPQPQRPQGDPEPLPYLLNALDQAKGAVNTRLQVLMRSAEMKATGHDPVEISRASALDLYWTPAQLVTHHTMNGCRLEVGDLLGTGTISADDEQGGGCLLELTLDGRRPLAVAPGVERSFLEDGDEVTLRAVCETEGFRSIGFGDCVGTVVGSAR